MTERIVLTETMEQTSVIFGSFDANVRVIENAFGVRITNRDTEKTAGDAIVITGEDEENVNLAAEAVTYLKKMASFSEELSTQSVDYVVNTVKSGKSEELRDYGEDCICITTRGRPIKAKTANEPSVTPQS